jgi:hypothetical protein
MLARVVAGVFTPANVVLAVMAYVALRHSGSAVEAFGWWALTLVLVVGVPYGILFRALRAGRVDDRQVVRRSQRPWLFVMALVCVALALGVLAVADAPREVVVLVVSMAAGLVAMSVVTLVTKASMHLAVASGAVAVVLVEQPGGRCCAGAAARADRVGALAGWAALGGADRARCRHRRGGVVGGLRGVALTAGGHGRVVGWLVSRVAGRA